MLWEFSSQQLLTAFTFVCCVSYICGWLTDRIFGYSGFSVIGNWLILLVGAFTGLLVYNLLGYRFYWNSQFTMFLTLGSSLAMLFIMLTIKTAFNIR
ncbi:MAG: hypothetical protein WBC71_04170 [Salaquimonas sp.]